MTSSLVDLTFGINNQARALLNLLDMEPHFAPEGENGYEIETRTYPLFLPRMPGICLEVRKNLVDRETLYIFFCEASASDQIFVGHWLGSSTRLPVTASEVPEEIAQFFTPYGNTVAAIGHIEFLCRRFLGTLDKP